MFQKKYERLDALLDVADTDINILKDELARERSYRYSLEKMIKATSDDLDVKIAEVQRLRSEVFDQRRDMRLLLDHLGLKVVKNEQPGYTLEEA